MLSSGVEVEYDGVMGVVDACLIAKALAVGGTGIATNFMANTLETNPIVRSGSAAQKAHFLMPFTASPQMAAFCLTKLSGGSDVAASLSMVRRDGDDYILNGSKTLTSKGRVANLYTVFASLDTTQKHGGICAFARPVDTSGVHMGRKLEKMGQWCADTAEVGFEDVRLPRLSLLAAEGEGF
ncbi:Acyl-CoA dehydrogenase, short-chain specific [Candidatus Entotheonellaceae bacterium PAL068K]